MQAVMTEAAHGRIAGRLAGVAPDLDVVLITGDNSSGYTGTTAVTDGILLITNGGALGAATGVDATGTTVGGTITNTGNHTGTNGTLQLSGVITVGSP